MDPLTDFIHAEMALRNLLHHGGHRQPDRVEYWERSVAFFWNDSKTVVVVDLEDAPDDEYPLAA